MSDGVLRATVIVAAVWIVTILLSAWLHQPGRGTGPPPRPEWLRERYARKPVTGPLAYLILAAALMPFVLPAALLMALSDDELGRSVGLGLAAEAAAQLGIGIWRGRPERRRLDRERLLARSEAYWSPPDAESYARELRRPGLFSHRRYRAELEEQQRRS